MASSSTNISQQLLPLELSVDEERVVATTSPMFVEESISSTMQADTVIGGPLAPPTYGSAAPERVGTTSHLMGAMREIDLEMYSGEEYADFRNRCLPRLMRFSRSHRLPHTIQTYARVRVVIVNTALIMVMRCLMFLVNEGTL